LFRICSGSGNRRILAFGSASDLPCLATTQGECRAGQLFDSKRHWQRRAHRGPLRSGVGSSRRPRQSGRRSSSPVFRAHVPMGTHVYESRANYEPLFSMQKLFVTPPRSLLTRCHGSTRTRSPSPPATRIRADRASSSPISVAHLRQLFDQSTMSGGSQYRSAQSFLSARYSDIKQLPTLGKSSLGNEALSSPFITGLSIKCGPLQFIPEFRLAAPKSMKMLLLECRPGQLPVSRCDSTHPFVVWLCDFAPLHCAWLLGCVAKVANLTILRLALSRNPTPGALPPCPPPHVKTCSAEPLGSCKLAA